MGTPRKSLLNKEGEQACFPCSWVSNYYNFHRNWLRHVLIVNRQSN